MRFLRGLKHSAAWMIFLTTPLLQAAPSSHINGLFVGLSPSPSRANTVDAWNQAELDASRIEGARVVCGNGSSMEPLYPSGTVLVVKPVAYNSLQRGSTVMFYNRNNKPVTHLLVGNTRSGWTCIGINNEEKDRELVTPDNLVGLVVAAYAPSESVPFQQVASLVATRPF